MALDVSFSSWSPDCGRSVICARQIAGGGRICWICSESIETGQPHLMVMLMLVTIAISDDHLERAAHLVARLVAGRVDDSMTSDAEEAARRLFLA